MSNVKAVFALLAALVVASLLLSLELGGKGLLCNGCVTGGTVTALNWLNISSGYRNITGMASVASVVLNGKGENLTGYSASKLNASWSGGTQVTITTQVSSYGYRFTYYPSAAYSLYNYTLTPISNVYFNYNCPFGFTCSQSLSSGGTVDIFTMLWIVTGPGEYIAPWDAQQVAYAQACANAGGRAILLNSATLNINSGTFAASYECVKIGGNRYADIYQDNIFRDTYNATISITNGTAQGTIRISDVNPDGYDRLTNTYAIGEGITDSGYNINQQNIPLVLYLYGPNKFVAVNPFSVPTALTGAESATLPSGLLIPEYTAEGYTVYSNQTITNIDNLNSNVQALTYSPVGSAYSNLNINGFSASNPVATLNLTVTPTFYTAVQVISPFKMLGIGIPVAQPQIASLSPNPLTSASAATNPGVFIVRNAGSSGGSIYITGACGGNSFTSQQSPVFINAGATGQASVQITAPINPANATEQVNCAATAHSIGGIYASPTFAFSLKVRSICGSGFVYVNSTGNCQPIQPNGGSSNYSGGGTSGPIVCRQGFTAKTLANGTTICQQNSPCPTGYSLNQTASPPFCQPISPSQQVDWLLVAVLIVVPASVIGGLLLYARSRKRR